MKHKFWMWIHDWAEKLWHYAYRQANPKKRRDEETYRYKVTYVNSNGEEVPKS